jgi:lipid A 3-O-deacylase
METNGYTPNHIDQPEIQQLDRPYASTLTVRAFNTAIRSSSKVRITNTATLGVLGPLAGGKEIQESIHRWIGYTMPLGWHNQIRNEPIINYQLNYEKKLAGDEAHLLITAVGMARAGTLSTKAAAGFALMTGSFLSPFSSQVQNHKRFHIHFYDQPVLNVIAYDATLQGGLLNGTSPYTIPGKAINRIVFQNRFGMVVNYKSIMLEYWQSFLTREYKTGIEPKTGGVQIAIRL